MSFSVYRYLQLTLLLKCLSIYYIFPIYDVNRPTVSNEQYLGKNLSYCHIEIADHFINLNLNIAFDKINKFYIFIGFSL